MPIISDTRTSATGVTVANIVAGSRFEFPPGNRITRLIGGIVSSVSNVIATFSVGDRIIAENYTVPVEVAAGVVSPDRDFNWRATASPGERIVVSTTNNNAGNAIVTLYLDLT